MISCGGDSSSSSKSVQRQEQQLEEPLTEGEYRAILRPMNTTINGFIPYGKAEINLSGDILSVETYLDDNASVAHMQNVHMGKRCPTLSDDKNGDGLIDINEAYAVVGKIIMPLDSDLSAQEAGKDVFPKGTSFTYERSASLSSVLQDLHLKDENTADHVTKLAPRKELSLVGKVVLMHGTSQIGNVPETVATQGTMTRHQSIPIVCGIISKVERDISP